MEYEANDSAGQSHQLGLLQIPEHSAQVKEAIKIFELNWPDSVGVWIFDNSSNHDGKAGDALAISKMNVNPEGAQGHMRDTIIPVSNPHGLSGKPQSMVFPSTLPDNHPYKKFEGQPKGMKVVLEELGLIQETAGKKKTVGTCKACKETKARKSHIEQLSPMETEAVDHDEFYDTEDEEENHRPKDCCMTRILSLQEDLRMKLHCWRR